MIKKTVFLLAATGLVFVNSGCTSQKTEDETQLIETADVDKIEGDLELPEIQNDPALDMAFTETPLTETPLTETPIIEGTNSIDGTLTTTETTTTTTIDGYAPPVVETTTTYTETPLTEAPITETPIDTSYLTETPVATNTTTTYSSSYDSDELTETPITDPAVVAATLQAAEKRATKSTAKKSSTSTVRTSTKSSGSTAKASTGGLKKVALTTPYQGADGGWINTVYVVRPKETLTDISMKIFASDRSEDLKKIGENSFLKSRAPRVGDKIYYSSPNRPDDSSRTMLYQEDMGLVPETYVAKKGDNLKKVSKELLGFDNAWKEVWTSNSVESQGSLKEGELLRYWAEAPAMAATLPPPLPPPTTGASLVDPSQMPSGADSGMGTLPPPPADANANLPPPPTGTEMPPMGTDGTDPMAAGGVDSFPPPPPVDEMAELPPPPPAEDLQAAAPRKKINLDEEVAAEEGGLDSDTMMSLGALGVLVALLALVIIRRKKQKAAQLQAEQEQQNNEMNA
ncbi:hypothetical protein [Pseudobdellovibrio exovorus]|uniref:LysM domain-containing protein n=1 Tax=Pseudobdellovibrio exovorus JSS TaxID=1184267 RepID=M4V781_9BACT|nr:hypothetical protein [Pseudobdellovibrio exovorus]AGH94295.1 hypothetical protein A11Q_75 [Pseudobdellovibrio exovorus JSS]